MKRAALALSALALVSSGCGNIITTEIIGVTGVAVDEMRNPVVLVKLCRGTVDHVELSGTREGLADDEPNPSYGGWDAIEPQRGLISINLGTGSKVWTGPELAVEPDRSYIVDASSTTADAATSQAVFSAADLASLKPGHVLIGNRKPVSRAAFETESCATS